MAPLLERKLIVVTGKGGVGKTTVACALGMVAARRGLRTVVAELGEQHRLPELFGLARTSDPGEEIELERDLWGTCIDPDKALIEWLRIVSGRLSARVMAASSSFHYFAAAAPGARELVSLMKVRELCEGGRGRRDRDPYDLVILDAPASGHALALLNSPHTFGAIVRAGPLSDQAKKVRELLQDPGRSGYVAVAHATEMAVTETLELEEGLRVNLDRDLDAVVVNGTIPRRFTREEMTRVSAATDPGNGALANFGADAPLASRAARAARTAYERTRRQQSQIARLRRQRFAEGKPPKVLSVPFKFIREMDLDAEREIADSLARGF
ncbi:MAG TPA: ArsA family ATPase [Solirubrobacteraceae bacterium]|jgi:anion-transporting  ArsA/GET3 family ATPase